MKIVIKRLDDDVDGKYIAYLRTNDDVNISAEHGSITSGESINLSKLCKNVDLNTTPVIWVNKNNKTMRKN